MSGGHPTLPRRTMIYVVMLTLVVTFSLVVGLALLVLLTVAAPPLRARGSRMMASLDRLQRRVRAALRSAVGSVRAQLHQRSEQYRLQHQRLR